MTIDCVYLKIGREYRTPHSPLSLEVYYPLTDDDLDIQGKYMTKAPHFFARVLLGALILAPATASYALEGGRLSKETTITLDQARVAAMKAQPGKILDQELEHRQGGSGLRYSFDIKVGTVTHEVGIDAKTGAVLQNSAEVNK